MKQKMLALAGGAKKYLTSYKFKGTLMGMAICFAMMGLFSVSFADDVDGNQLSKKAFNLIFGLTKMAGAALIVFGVAKIGMGVLGGQEGQNLNAGIAAIIAGTLLVASKWVVTNVFGIKPESMFETAMLDGISTIVNSIKV